MVLMYLNMAFKCNLWIFRDKIESYGIKRFICNLFCEGRSTHLIPKHTDGASGGNLIRAEPDRRQAGGHPEDKDLG